MSGGCLPADATAELSGPEGALDPTDPSVLPACLDALEVSLRNPLRALENVAEAIGSVRSPEQQRHLLRAIKQAALMIERSSDAALDLLRCQHAVLQPDLSVFTLRSLLHEIRIAARSARPRSPRMIQLRFPDCEAVVRGDRRRLVRITATVLAAIDGALEEGGAITLTASVRPLSAERAEVELRVGLPLESLSPELIARMFGIGSRPPIFRSAEDLEVYSAIALARRLGVTLQGVEVPPGVVLRLTCPLVTIRPLPLAAAPARAATSALILLYDTPGHPLRALASGLGDSGYEPLRAQHRDEALGILFGRSPAAIVIATDAYSDAPLQFARQVRSNFRTSQIPIVLVARDLSMPELSMARRYADGVLVAPVTVPDTVRYLNGCLATERRATPRELELY